MNEMRHGNPQKVEEELYEMNMPVNQRLQPRRITDWGNNAYIIATNQKTKQPNIIEWIEWE